MMPARNCLLNTDRAIARSPISETPDYIPTNESRQILTKLFLRFAYSLLLEGFTEDKFWTHEYSKKTAVGSSDLGSCHLLSTKSYS